MKKYLDDLKKKYETVEFIKNDPIQFPHRFFYDRKNLEIMGFISSIFAYGKRELFIRVLDKFLEISNNNPLKFILNFEKNEDKLTDLLYRFYKDYDIKALCFPLMEILKKGMSLGEFFYEKRDKNTQIILQKVYDYFSNSKYNPKTQGFSFMMSNPNKGCANKRMNMFLRWMVRPNPVDFGVWDFISPADLIIPLDVHVGCVSRKLGLLSRKQNDFKSAFELTQKLKEFNKDDPVGYDFALFGAGVNKENSQVLIQV